MLKSCKHEIPRPIEEVETLVPFFTIDETRVDKTDLDKTSAEHLFKPDIDSCLDPSHVRKLGRCEELECEVFLGFQA